ncbi:hypothetical protein [Paenibacillus agricola]|uniref:Uncharacterized protein n=1 Tax=Paenibacillus agricola TaxID=2716264 RepID=A0ABX0JB23_9BACL|nr:hypothetical protein [Paenibacillus agricola]NHN33143.1 hypothetical protein [Paenibacillus agricola]
MWDIIMYLGIGLVVYFLYRGLNNKPIIPGLSGRKKKDSNKRQAATQVKEIKGSFNDLIGVKQVFGNLFELHSDNKDVRKFVGSVRCEPINYALRSYDEQAETDRAYEHLLASLSLGPGREVKIAPHVHSRPIELVDQMKLYYDNFPNLDPIAQRYAQSMFFPFMETWQKAVEEYDYARYFLVMLDYTEKLIGDMDEESILIKVRNEFGRLGSNIMSNYGKMGGYSEVCQQRQLYEALYFATHKKTASIKNFRRLFERENTLSQFALSDYSRDSYRYLEEEENEE